MTVLVTGGAGFIGSHVCEALLREGRDVVALENFDDFYEAAAKDRNLQELRESPRFELVRGDIRDPEIVSRVLRDHDVLTVIHLAARAGVRPSLEDPVGYQDVNVNGTTVLLEAARSCGVEKFIFGSSSSVYGNSARVPFCESDPAVCPISPYAASKRAGELIAHSFHEAYGLPITCLRFFTVYGPRERPDLAIHKFARLIDAGEPIPVYGDGSALRDFTFVSDIVEGVLSAARHCSRFHVYNLGAGRPVTVLQLIEALEQALERPATLNYLPPQTGDVRGTHADISLARRELGYEPRVVLPAGLKHFVSWMRGIHVNA